MGLTAHSRYCRTVFVALLICAAIGGGEFTLRAESLFFFHGSPEREVAVEFCGKLFTAAAATRTHARSPRAPVNLCGRLFAPGANAGDATPEVARATFDKEMTAPKHAEEGDRLKGWRDQDTTRWGTDNRLRRLPPVQYTEPTLRDEVKRGGAGLPMIELVDEPLSAFPIVEPARPLSVMSISGPEVGVPPADENAPLSAPADGSTSDGMDSFMSIAGPDGNPLRQSGQSRPQRETTPQVIVNERTTEVAGADEVRDAGTARAHTIPQESSKSDTAIAQSPGALEPGSAGSHDVRFAEDPALGSVRDDRYGLRNGRRGDITRRDEGLPLGDRGAVDSQSAAPKVVRLPSIDFVPLAPLSAPTQSPTRPVPKPNLSFAEQPPKVAEAAAPRVQAPQIPRGAANRSIASAAPPQPSHRTARLDGLLLHATEARHHVQQGFGAANRGMLYTARKEFLQALRTVAEAKDAARGRRTHMDALAAGLTAVEEAERIRSASTTVANINLARLIATHRTPVLQSEDVSEMLPLAVIDIYHEYAQEQLGSAVAGDPSGSMALYGLARVYEHLGSENGADRVARSRQSVAFHEGALLACPDNYLAAHELGVVLSKLGRHDRALAMLTRSIQLNPTSVAYRNLAIVSRQAGQHQAATAAEQYAAQMAQREGASARVGPYQVALLEPSEFARTSEQLTSAESVAEAGPTSLADGGKKTVVGVPEPSPTFMDRLAAPLKALSPQTWVDSERK